MNIQVLVFSAPWCKSCEVIKPIISNLKGMYTSCEFKDVDIDEDPDLVDEFNVQKIPTTVVLDSDKELDRFQGTDTAALRNMIMEYCEEQDGDADF